jgi:hypothetical protein
MALALKRAIFPALAGGLMATLAGCGSETTQPDAVTATSFAADETAGKAAFPASLPVFGDGYPQAGAACRRVGESELTVDFLDDSADLVACPTKDDARALGGKVVGLVDGFTLVSVPTGQANAGLSVQTPATRAASAAQPKDIVRGKGGLEEKCLNAVAAQGTKVIGTKRIEESEAATAIYVNVVGGQAPWRCLGYRDGTIGEIMYTGDEGAM